MVRWLMAITARVRQWWRHRERSSRRATTRADFAAHAARLRRLADAEGISFDDLYDAIRQLAVTHPRTMDQVIDVVEKHGLDGAEAALGERDQ